MGYSPYGLFLGLGGLKLLGPSTLVRPGILSSIFDKQTIELKPKLKTRLVGKQNLRLPPCGENKTITSLYFILHWPKKIEGASQVLDARGGPMCIKPPLYLKKKKEAHKGYIAHLPSPHLKTH